MHAVEKFGPIFFLHFVNFQKDWEHSEIAKVVIFWEYPSSDNTTAHNFMRLMWHLPIVKFYFISRCVVKTSNYQFSKGPMIILEVLLLMFKWLSDTFWVTCTNQLTHTTAIYVSHCLLILDLAKRTILVAWHHTIKNMENFEGTYYSWTVNRHNFSLYIHVMNGASPLLYNTAFQQLHFKFWTTIVALV